MPSNLAVVFALFLACAGQPTILGAQIATSADTADHHFDGPAELPREYVHSDLADTPAPGTIHNIKEKDNLQDAINDAKCGDTLALQPGTTFSGLFRFPAKPCDDSHWVIIRSGASDESLPPEGTRALPCHAGIASLPGRPDFHCGVVRNVMAKIVFDADGDSGPILFMPGANHYRLVGLEITRARPEFHMRDLAQTNKPGSTAHHIIFDRVWMHGTPQDETKGGVHLTGMTYIAIIDSYLSDFHCVALKGSCTDAQAINGGGGDDPGGPYKIVNNFLEASGENILFGGAPGSATPADIEIRRNHLFKPMIWKLGQPGYVAGYTGNPFIVKNHLELKNAQRVLFEANILENCWGGFSQTGFSIVLTPANQGGKCPACRVTDITIRYSVIRHVASAFGIANVMKRQTVPSSGGERYSIHDVVVDDIDGKEYSGFGNFATMLSVAPPLKSVHIDHVTAFPQRAILTLINPGEKIEDFKITNSVFAPGERQITTAGGGRANCAQAKDDPSTILSNCFTGSVFMGNMVISGSGGWPRDNILVKNAKDAGLRNFNNGHGGDYHLCREKNDGDFCTKRSPALTNDSRGKPIGADTDAIDRAVAGVL